MGMVLVPTAASLPTLGTPIAARCPLPHRSNPLPGPARPRTLRPRPLSLLLRSPGLLSPVPQHPAARLP